MLSVRVPICRIFGSLTKKPLPKQIAGYSATANTKSLTSLTLPANYCNVLVSDLIPIYLQIQTRNFAARRGTRTKKEKKKIKKVVHEKVFVFKQLQKQASLVYKPQRPADESDLLEVVDDVHFQEKFRSKAYTFEEAVKNHKQLHNPTMFNVPNSPLILRLDIDLVYPNRPNKFQDGWRSIIEMKKPFLLHGMEMPTILALCPGNETDMIEEAMRAGADLAGSNEIIKSIQEGHTNPNDYEYIVCHPNLVTDLTVIRGLIKRKFPSIKTKTISADIATAVKRLKGGIKTSTIKNDKEPDFCYIETPIGTLDMDTLDLEGNFIAILNDCVPRRVPGKEPENFIIKCSLTTPNTDDVLKIDVSSYLQNIKDQQRSQIKEKQRVDPEIEEAEAVAV